MMRLGLLNVLACSAIALLEPQELRLEERGTFELEIAAPPAPLGRVAADGHLILTQGVSTVVVLSRNGQTLWQREVGTTGSRITAVDGDAGGRLFALDASHKVIHTLRLGDGAVESTWTLRRGSSAAPGPHSLAADHEGGVFVLTEQGTADRYSPGRATPASMRLSGGVAQRDPLHAGGWIAAPRTGRLLVRPPGSLRVLHLSERGTVRTFADIPPVDESTEEPATIFASAVLSDGRLVLEIVERTPAVGPDGLPEVRLARRLHVMDGSSVARTGVLPLRGGLGQLIGSGPDDELWFVTTRQMLRPGERPRLTRAVIR